MWRIQALLYSFLIPKEFNLLIGSLSLSPYRLLLLLLAPWVFIQLLTNRKFRWQALDTLALLVCTWPAIALSLNTGIGTAIEGGGIFFLETFVPFFCARLIIYKYDHLIKISKTVVLVASIMAIFAIPEAITGKPFIHQLAASITGNSFDYTMEKRLGVWRSYGVTDHPIVLGSVCAVAIPLALALYRKRRTYGGLAGVSFAGVIASASSGPILTLIVQIGLYIWSILTRGNRHKWWLLLLAISVAYITIDLLSNRDPFRVMFSYLLFNEHNGYVRYNMWLNSFFLATQSVESMIVGYGFSTDMMSLLENYFWTNLMSASIDSYWLVILIRYGFPMLLLNVALVVLVLRANVSSYRKFHRKSERLLIQAWLITAVSLGLVASTVHFWGSTASLFFIVLGSACMGKKSKSTIRTSQNTNTANNDSSLNQLQAAKP